MVESNGGIEKTRLEVVTAELEELKRRESALTHLNARLKELDRAKTEFFSNVSREFRTPLMLLLGPLREILGSPASTLAPNSREVLELAQNNALRLLKLVDSLLDFSRVGDGQSDAAQEPTDLAAFTAELAGNFRSACEWAGLSLVVDCPILPEHVHIDRDLWERIVLNLVANAFKSTAEGTIEVRLRALEGAVRLTVRDTGGGIPAAELPHLFDHFRRMSTGPADAQDEIGIGLARVRDLVQVQGGSIDVDSKTGQGSTFTVVLPLGLKAVARSDGEIGMAGPPGGTPLAGDVFGAEDAFEQDGVPAEENLAAVTNGSVRARILVADDNAEMRAYLVHMLEAAGFAVDAQADGMAALEVCRSQLPDAVISDVLMPGLNGFELIERLRADERTAAIPVLLLTGRAGEDSRIEGLAAGADDYLVKPLARRELVARVEGAIRLSRLRRELVRREMADFESMFSMAPDGFIVASAGGKILAANQRAQQLFGYSPAVFMELQVEALLPEDRRTSHVAHRASYMSMPETRPMCPARELLALRSDGSTFIAEIGLAPVQFRGQPCTIAVVRDLTERKQFEQKLVEAQKLEAMGQLTGGLAHDFNNLLGVMLGNLELLKPGLADDEARHQHDLAMHAGRQAAQITKSLLAVARKQSLEPRKVGVGKILSELRPLIRQAVGKHVSLRESSSSACNDGICVLVDPSGLSNAILNLVMNARDAMPVGGEIHINIDLREIQNDGIGAPYDIVPGLYMVLTVADNGVGMSAEVVARAFEPFFTTKERDHGTGLGLSMVYGFAHQSGGTATLFSQPGLGTTVHLYLPAIVGQSAESGIERAIAEAEDGKAAAAEIGQSILVVDDEELLLETTHKQVERLGYRAVKSASPTDALEQLRSQPFDMLLSDVTMPGMDGIELARQAIILQPGIRVVLVSGFAAEAINASWPMLEKPFSREQLGEIIGRALSQPLPEQGVAPLEQAVEGEKALSWYKSLSKRLHR